MRLLAGFVGLGLLCLGCSGSVTEVGDSSGGTGTVTGISNGFGGGTAAGGQGNTGGASADSRAGTGGVNAAGSAGTSTTVGNLFVDRIEESAVDKLDLLFMIDNSASMADKQDILKAAIPPLLQRLTSPNCVDANGDPTGSSAATDGTCAAGSAPEFAPIGDIHLGIVSSSLGSHGGVVCAQSSSPDAHLNDMAHLIATERTGLASWNSSGFLAWDPSGTKNTPAGESSISNLNANFAAMVAATGETGCGYEASLESWYRFLIDPEPPAEVVKVNNVTVRQGIDQELLTERAAFLRPDSLVAIVMLTDENDCSIRDDGVGWFVGSTAPMPKATAACATNPNDPCCRSCAQNEASPPSGCASLSADPVCMAAPAGSYNTWDALHDSLNERCFDQKQRFGFDLLYETQRYVTGLTSPTLTLESDATKTVVNPLFDAGTSGKAPRDPSLVFLAGIVGVPWQDIASADSLTSPTALTYLTAAQLLAQGRWTQILGNAAASPPVPPSDPFMIETWTPRLGMNPNTAVSTEPPSSMNPLASAINGHEYNIPNFDDLQYACTFALATPKVCAAGDAACDCAAATGGDTSALVAANSPVCQPPSGGAPGTTQYFAKAYPGARELTVLRDFGENAIVASICPKLTSSATASDDPSYGYNPAATALVERLKEALKGKCLPNALPHTQDQAGNDTSSVACEVTEVQSAGSCDCSEPGRAPADTSISSAIFKQLQASGGCGSTGQPSCDTSSFCMCQIAQEFGANLAACQADATPTAPGFCYIDDPASAALAQCPTNQKRLLRFVSQGATQTPANNAITFLSCVASPSN